MKNRVIVQLPTLGGNFPFRARRAQFGISQRELAARSGINEGTIRQLEKGQPIGLPKLRRLAPFLELTFAQALAIMVSLDKEDDGFQAIESTSPDRGPRADR